ncbi:MAG: hypothetical protein ACPLXL_00345 [Minisyncoccia bacterium]
MKLLIKTLNIKKFFLITGISCLILFFLINHFTYSFTNTNQSEEYFEVIISDQLSLTKDLSEKENIFLNLDPLSIIVVSSEKYPSVSFYLENSSKNSILLFEKDIKPGVNIYPLNFLLVPDVYNVKIKITENKIYTQKFFVKNSFLKYQSFYPFKIQFFYPNWQVLDPETIEKIYQNLFQDQFKKIGEGVKVLLLTKDKNNAQFAVFIKEIDDSKNDLNLKNYSEKLAELEAEALKHFDFIQEYKILNKNFTDKEGTYQTEILSQGINYLIVSKSILLKNFLNQKSLLILNFTFPKQYSLYYQPFIDYIFNEISY